MNRRTVGMLSIMAFVVAGFVWSGKNIFAVEKKGKHKNEIALHHEAMGENKQNDEGEQVEGEKATEDFDIQRKQKEVQSLLERGVEFCANNNLVTVCHAFTHTKDFIEGELYLFLLDTKGVVYAHGDQSDLLWKNLWDYRDSFGAFAIQSIIKTAQAGANWLTYDWSGAVKVSFVQKISIDDKEFVIGCGYYPHSKKYAAIGLVKGAVALFNQDVQLGHGVEGAFSEMGYPLSNRFIYGDLYLYALDFNGIIRAQGDDPNLIGRNALNRKDAKGKEINKEIIEKLKTKKEGEGIWIEYISKNVLKIAYAEKVKDEKGNEYFIACGYYPDSTRDLTVDLVRRAYQFMKGSGVSVASKEFTDKAIITYNWGDLYIFVYDMKGKCIAHGTNPALVGQNQFDEKDEDGRYVVREMIKQAQAGGGWLDFKLKNSFQATYVEKIDMGIDSYVIGAAFFPVSKPETMALLVKSAIGFLQSSTEDQLFKDIVDRKGEFIRGDLFLFACDLDGYCYAWGSDYQLIWKNILDWKDDDGKQFIKNMIEESQHGADHYVYKFNKATRVDYVEQVEKNGKKYIIGSGFYK
jgi:signal transduction histidine kinase